MAFQIIIKGKKTWKGKNIGEFARNMENNGWPSEFMNEEVRDRVAHVEKKERRPLNKMDIKKITRDIGNIKQK